MRVIFVEEGRLQSYHNRRVARGHCNVRVIFVEEGRLESYHNRRFARGIAVLGWSLFREGSHGGQVVKRRFQHGRYRDHSTHGHDYEYR